MVLMRSIFICNSINSDMQTYFEEIQNIDFDSDVVWGGNKKLSKKRFPFFNLTSARSSSSMSTLIKDAGLANELVRSLSIDDKNVFVFFTTVHIANFYLILLLLIRRINFVCMIHDVVPHPGFKSTIIKFYNWLSFNFAKSIICFNDSDRLKLSAKGISCHSLHLGGFEERITPIRSSVKTILMFGRMTSYKGISTFIEVAKECLEIESCGYQFVLAGAGDLTSYGDVSNISNLTVLNRYLDDKEIDSLLDDADACMFPYSSATQSGAIVRAFSSGRPVIASNVGALSEYVVDNSTGFLVEELSPTNFIQKLGLLDRNLEEISLKTRSVFNEKYSKRAFKRDFKEIHLKITNNTH